MKTNWILKTGTTNIDCSSFPYAYRTMYNLVRKGVETGKQSFIELTKSISIVGPANLKGERTTYSYHTATELAKGQGLLTVDGQINSREFKRK